MSWCWTYCGLSKPSDQEPSCSKTCRDLQKTADFVDLRLIWKSKATLSDTGSWMRPITACRSTGAALYSWPVKRSLIGPPRRQGVGAPCTMQSALLRWLEDPAIRCTITRCVERRSSRLELRACRRTGESLRCAYSQAITLPPSDERLQRRIWAYGMEQSSADDYVGMY